MPDLYQIVNSDDEIIGHKYRDDIDYQNDYYRIAALWLTNSQGKILLAQRLISKDKDPGKWGPAAAGTLEEGETYESNIYKEAEEEIGLAGVEFKLGPKMKFEVPRKAYCQWFLSQCDKDENEFISQPTEVERVKWVNLDELKQDLQANPEKYVPSMKLILKKLYS